MKQSHVVWIAALALLFTAKLWSQNPTNPLQVGMQHWYQANQVTQFATCQDPTGLAFDGAHMWVGCYGSNSGSLREYNASDGSLVRTIASSFLNPSAVVYDGVNIWASNAAAGTVQKVNAGTGAHVLHTQ